jgi:hypothetical protein
VAPSGFDNASLAALIKRADVKGLGSAMRRRWSAGATWSADDAGTVSWFLLFAVHAIGATWVHPLYVEFAPELKRHHEQQEWVGTMNLRAQAVEAFEGEEVAVEWLQEAAAAVPYALSGYPMMLAARRLLSLDRPEGAVELLRAAVRRAMIGVRWYLVETLGEMSVCQVRLGRVDLAFEYSRASVAQQYESGQASPGELLQACVGLAEMFGQVDYQVELHRNVAGWAEQEGRRPEAALAWSTAAIQLAHLGAWDEAGELLRCAAETADRDGRAIDRVFAFECRTLARIIDPRDVTTADLALAVRDAEVALDGGMRTPDGDGIAQWLRILHDARAAGGDAVVQERAIATVHLVVLRARLAESSGEPEEALELYAGIGSGREAALRVAFEHRVRLLLLNGRSDEVRALASTALSAPMAQAERYSLRARIAAAHLADGDRGAAYRWAEGALVIWRRVLAGLYDPLHKGAWLNRGAEALGIGIRALGEQLEEMPETVRRHRLFALCEESKSRLVGDMLNRRDYVPGPYLLASAERGGTTTGLLSFVASEDPDWSLALNLQMPLYADGLTNHVYAPGSSVPTSIEAVDLRPLRTTLRVSIGEDQRLLASADSVTYDDTDATWDRELYAELASAREGPGK